MKKLIIGLMVVTMLILSSCDFGELTGGWNNNDDDDNVTLVELIEAEILAETDVDAVIEEDIDIDIPTSLSKALPGPGGNGRNMRRIRLKVKQGIDSVDVQRSIEYTADDTALVTLTKTLFGTMVINQTDTAIVDTPEVWEKSYEYTTTSYMQFVQVECADSNQTDSTESDTTLQWKLMAKSIESGETAGILNTIESVTLEADDDSTMLVFDNPEALFVIVRGRPEGWGSFRERPGQQETEVYVAIDGSDDVNVLGSSGRYFKLLDDGEDLDLTADDNIFSGTVLKGRGQSRLRVRMITTATFIEEDAPVEIATWFLPVR